MYFEVLTIFFHMSLYTVNWEHICEMWDKMWMFENFKSSKEMKLIDNYYISELMKKWPLKVC